MILTLRRLIILIAMPVAAAAAQAEPLLAYAAQTQTNGPFSLYWTNTGGRTAPLLVQGPLGDFASVQEFDFAPQDSGVVYRANLPPTGPTELYLGGTYFPSPGGKISLPLPSGRNVTHYALSSNSSSIAYIADGVTAGVFEAFQADIKGRIPAQKVSATPVSGGNVLDVAVSPDGRWMSYRGDIVENGKFEVFASAIPTTSTWKINLNLGANEDVISSLISPDSARLAFLVNKQVGVAGLHHRLFTRAIQGAGAVVPIADTGGPAGDVVDYKYSTFGSKIALLEDRDTSGQFELYLTNSNGSGGTVKISAPLSAQEDVQKFAFSANGQWLAYETNVPGVPATQGKLFLYSVSGGGAPVKVNQDPTGNAGLFAFSPDSKNIVYQQSASSSTLNNLFVRPVNLSAAERELNGVASGGNSIDAFVIGADNQSVAYIGDEVGIGTLFLSRLDGTGTERRVNPQGQSVAAVLAAPLDFRASAGDQWAFYR